MKAVFCVRNGSLTPREEGFSALSDRDFDYLSDTVEFFDLRIFL